MAENWNGIHPYKQDGAIRFLKWKGPENMSVNGASHVREATEVLDIL
jgi:hypothetical protein